MGSNKQKESIMTSEKEEEELAKQDMWKYMFGFTEMAVLKCAVELGIPEALESHGRAMSVQELSSALGCCANSQALSRVMRFLSNRGIFRETIANPKPSYAQTPLSRQFTRSRMAAILLLESSPAMVAPWHALAGFVGYADKRPFEAAHGKDIWGYAAGDPCHSRLINEAMACFVEATVGAMVEEPGLVEEVFGGARTVADVGGGTGTAMRILVKACPWIRAVNFDLPHVVGVAEECERVDHLGGDMFEFVPNADVIFISSVLHDWSDDECIHILKKCREAIPKDKGKVVLIEVVIRENGQKKDQDNNNKNKNKLRDVGLFLDMVMMAHTTAGKERTLDEWAYVLRQAGFRRPTVRPIAAVQSVIEAFPA